MPQVLFAVGEGDLESQALIGCGPFGGQGQVILDLLRQVGEAADGTESHALAIEFVDLASDVLAQELQNCLV